MTDEDVEHAKSIRDFFRGVHQDRVIADMESYIDGTSEATKVPMPMTSHPAFAHAEDFVRRFNKDHVVITMCRPVKAFTKEEELNPTSLMSPSDRLVLARSMQTGPAPFVGDPLVNEARYFWSAWSDNLGRWIAGEARLEWRY